MPILSPIPEPGHLAEAKRWRHEADNLREFARSRHLTEGQRTAMLRQAEDAERKSQRCAFRTRQR